MALSNVFRATFIFELGDAGWSESIFMSGTSDANTLKAAKNLYGLRANILGTDAILAFLRVSQEGVWRDSLVDEPLIVGDAEIAKDVDGAKQNLQVIVKTPCAPPFVAYNARRECTELYRGTWFVRGIPQSIAVGTATGAQKSKWIDGLVAYFQALIAGGWGLVVRDRGAATNPEDPITGLGVNGANQIRVTLANNQTWPSGSSVVIRSTKFLPAAAPATQKINATWNILAVDNTHIDLQRTVGPMTWLSGGTARLVTQSFQQFTQIVPRGICERKAGRAFFSPRGRRKKYVHP